MISSNINTEIIVLRVVAFTKIYSDWLQCYYHIFLSCVINGFCSDLSNPKYHFITMQEGESVSKISLYHNRGGGGLEKAKIISRDNWTAPKRGFVECDKNLNYPFVIICGIEEMIFLCQKSYPAGVESN